MYVNNNTCSTIFYSVIYKTLGKFVRPEAEDMKKERESTVTLTARVSLHRSDVAAWDP